MYVAILYSVSDLETEICRFETPCNVLCEAREWVENNVGTFDCTGIVDGDYFLKLVRHDANGDLLTDLKDPPATYQITVTDGKGSVT